MTDGIHNAFALILGQSKPYSPSEEAARTVTLEFFDADPRSFRAGDYAQHFVNISYREARWAYNALSAMAERHDKAKAYAEHLIRERAVSVTGGDVRDQVAAEFDAWADRHIGETLADIRGHSQIASAMITGPSNFPQARMRKRWDAAERRADTLTHSVETIMKRMKRAAFPHGAPGEAIRASNPDAAELLAKKIAGLEAERDLYKALNAAWRKAGKPGIGDADGWTRFAELAQGLGWKPDSVAVIRKNCEGHYMARSRPMPPAEGYVLTNLNAQIKQAQARLAEIEAMPAGHELAEGGAVIDTPAGKVERIENGPAARIQLMFEGKPAAEIRAILKSNGFRWAPSQSAWQRHLNANGRAAADRALAQIMEA